MHKQHIDILKSIGKLVKSVRSETMDQTELGKRVGVSRTTISAIERGIGVNSTALFKVLCFLELTDLLHTAIDEHFTLVDANRSRKARKPREELSNDF